MAGSFSTSSKAMTPVPRMASTSLLTTERGYSPAAGEQRGAREAHAARVAVEQEDGAAVYAELDAQLARGGAKDLVGVERLADGARDAVDECFALGLRGELLGVALTRDELRGLAREGHGREHAAAVGRET